MKGGLGWHPERGELARKLKGAAGRRGARVPGSGPRGGRKQTALAHRRMRLRAGGADLSPGPRSHCRPRCACYPRTDAAAGGPLCTPGFVNSTRYVLPKARGPRAGPRRGARGKDPVGVGHLHVLRPACSYAPRVEHSRLAPGSCCFHVETAIQGREVGWSLAAPTCCNEVRSRPRGVTGGGIPGWNPGYPCPLLSLPRTWNEAFPA